MMMIWRLRKKKKKKRSHSLRTSHESWGWTLDSNLSSSDEEDEEREKDLQKIVVLHACMLAAGCWKNDANTVLIYQARKSIVWTSTNCNIDALKRANVELTVSTFKPSQPAWVPSLKIWERERKKKNENLISLNNLNSCLSVCLS